MRIGLARHVHQFVAAREDELRAVGVVRFDEAAVPARSGSAWRQAGGIVGRNAVPQIDIVLTVHVEGLYVEILDKPPTVSTHARETPVPLRFDRGPATGEEVSRRLAKVSIDPDPLYPEAADLEAFIEIDEGVVGPSACCPAPAEVSPGIAVRAAQEGNRVSRIAVLVVT